MKKVKIRNWTQYGDYMVFANIVSEYGLKIILTTNTAEIEAVGTEAHIYTFCQVLKKKEIRFEEVR
jgi:hypothetical protein